MTKSASANGKHTQWRTQRGRTFHYKKQEGLKERSNNHTLYGTTGTRKRPVLVSAKTASFLKCITFCKGINEWPWQLTHIITTYVHNYKL